MSVSVILKFSSNYHYNKISLVWKISWWELGNDLFNTFPSLNIWLFCQHLEWVKSLSPMIIWIFFLWFVERAANLPIGRIGILESFENVLYRGRVVIKWYEFPLVRLHQQTHSLNVYHSQDHTCCWKHESKQESAEAYTVIF